MLSAAVRARFLAPSHALADSRAAPPAACGVADTPAANAWVRLYLYRPVAGAAVAARFTAFGPPVVVAAADWFCEQLGKSGLDAARSITVIGVERALSLAPTERYAAILVADALGQALDDLKDDIP